MYASPGFNAVAAVLVASTKLLCSEPNQINERLKEIPSVHIYLTHLSNVYCLGIQPSTEDD